MSKVISRFAPSPTGHLHIGGARTALFSWLLARHYNGLFYLRIEDTDVERSKKEYTDGILEAMEWLGLTYDGPVVYQSQNKEHYIDVVKELIEKKHAYWCNCSVEEVNAMRELAKQKGEKPKYNGKCRAKNLDESCKGVVRLKAPDEGTIVYTDLVKGTIQVNAAELDDMVILRSDGMPTYQLAVVVDDHNMGITHVLRGDDHVSNTPKQIIIYRALGWEIPVFAHIPMILAADRQKLSKRHGARSVIEYKDDGILPQALINYLARLGWSHGDQELFSIEELITLFDGSNLQISPSAFDYDKLLWLNKQYLHATPYQALAKDVMPFIIKNGMTENVFKDVEKFIPLYRERAVSLADLAMLIKPVVVDSLELQYDENVIQKYANLTNKHHLCAIQEALEHEDDFNAQKIKQIVSNYIQEHNLKFKEIAPVLRVAISSVLGGPDLYELIELIGKEKTITRIRQFIIQSF